MVPLTAEGGAEVRELRREPERTRRERDILAKVDVAAASAAATAAA
jgi:hypothetical protein